MSERHYGQRCVHKHPGGTNALVLTELIIVIAIMALMVSVAMLSFSTMFGRTEFDKEVHNLISVLTMAQNAAAESDRKYAVILDIAEQTYTLRQFASLDLKTIGQEEAVLATGVFTDKCRLEYVVFDDLMDTRDWDLEKMEALSARFMAGHSGWQYGGKIVLLDADGNPYSVLVNRLSRVITLQPGDVEFLLPMEKEDVLF